MLGQPEGETACSEPNHVKRGDQPVSEGLRSQSPGLVSPHRSLPPHMGAITPTPAQAHAEGVWLPAHPRQGTPDTPLRHGLKVHPGNVPHAHPSPQLPG